MLAFGLRLFQLSRPNYLFGVTEYDDGVLFGNALRLVNGAIPYRDFAMVQPPGSTVLMAPVALLAKSIGSGSGLAAARLLTAAADTACVVVLGLLVRHRGALATGLACGIYAVYPAALNASQTFMLEPWLNLFCLLGLLALFDRDRLASRSRLAWAGACFGFAASIKIWALAPALVAAIVCLWRGRGHLKALLTYAGGLVAGVVIPCLPFFIAAPRSFTRSVFVAELIQATHGRVSPVPRLADITGLLGLGGLTGRGDIGRDPVVAGAVVAVILLVTIWLLAWRAAVTQGWPAGGSGLVCPRHGRSRHRDAGVAVRVVPPLRGLRRAIRRAHRRSPRGADRRSKRTPCGLADRCYGRDSDRGHGGRLRGLDRVGAVGGDVGAGGQK